jgi:exonuclease III
VKTYSTNHPDNTAHGGTAILIKKTINHYELPKYKSNHLQATVIKEMMTQYELTVATVYCPPKYNIEKENFKDIFQTSGHKFIAGGDYNSKHTYWDLV